MSGFERFWELVSYVAPNNFYSLPSTFETRELWTDTGEIAKGISQGRRVVSDRGRFGIRKPGNPASGSEEAFKEILAVYIARWLDVRVPPGELLCREGKPCFISFDIGPAAITWRTGITDSTNEAFKEEARNALATHCGVVVLDALVGAMDRHNTYNYLYAPREGHWYSIDYAFSFNTKAPRGVGPDSTFSAHYFPDMIRAVQKNPAPLVSALRLAEAIPDKCLENLCALPPAIYADGEGRHQMLRFLLARRRGIRALLEGWCTMVNLEGVLDNA